ncbi:MAG TPA: hypothetical protein VHH11_18215 [Gammaproteobacteria bacterium]|jgi:hypothetical protein|nr:hypothetical protein [Gammaproteobacteria bacterium]
MGHPADKETRAPEQPPVDDGRPGRIVVDSRGHNVWRWARAALDSTSILLKRLENKDLALEPTQKVPVVPGIDPRTPPKGQAAKPAAPARPGPKAGGPSPQRDARRPDPMRGQVRRDTGGGFDPYNSR